MKSTTRSIIVFTILLFLNNISSYGQQWSGSSTTENAIHRDGWVGVGWTNLEGQLHLAGGSGNQMHAVLSAHTDLPELMLSRGLGPSLTTFSNARLGFVEHPGGGGFDLTFSTANGDRREVNERMRITYSGRVGIGTADPGADLQVVGRTTTSVLEITGGADIAEPFGISDHKKLLPGSLLVIDPGNPGQLMQSTKPYDKRVAGVISGAGGLNPGLTLSQFEHIGATENVALVGRAYALTTTSNGIIEPGDLLTTSAIPGHAMKATAMDKANGAIIGKAMSTLESGNGLVLVLIQPR